MSDKAQAVMWRWIAELLAGVLVLVAIGLSTWALTTSIAQGSDIRELQTGTKQMGEVKDRLRGVEMAVASLPRDWPSSDFRQLLDERFTNIDRRLLVMDARLEQLQRDKQ